MVKNRGFYVKMRFLHHKNGRFVHHDKKSICYNYFKLICWVSLFLYFISSFLISKNNPHKTIYLNTTVLESNSGFQTRALFESRNSSSTQFNSHKSQKTPGLLNDIKIYVYELPSSYNEDWLSNSRCKNHLFASEVAIHKALLNSDVRTFDPWQADFFFVPVYVSCNFSTVNGFPVIGHAKSIMSSAVEFVSSQMPFWNRSNGGDHVFVASHDYGACFHAMEDKAIESGIPKFLKNSIILQTFGVKYKHQCQDVAKILIPPYISPEKVRSTLALAPSNGQRDIWTFFRGKMEVHPKNISGRFYSKGVRTLIWQKYNHDRRFYLKRHRFPGYQSEILRSTFCLCPLGWAPWSPRLVEAVVLGCVPVIIADGIQLPFSTTVNWPKISLTVAERDVGKLSQILEHVASTNLSTIQNNLWNAINTKALLFNDEVQDNDATWQTLSALARMLNRSHKKSLVVNQSIAST